MELKKLHMGTIVFGWEAMDEVNHLLAQTFGEASPTSEPAKSLLDGQAHASPEQSSPEKLDGGANQSR
jgi:phospholipid-translocating ATPase